MKNTQNAVIQKNRRLPSTPAIAAFIIGTGIFLPSQQSTADINGALAALQRTSLVQDAPPWADKASSAVRYRFTTQGQAMLQAAKQMPPLAQQDLIDEQLPIAAAVIFGQTMFNKDTSALPQNEESIAFDPTNSNRIVGGYNDYRGLLSPFNFTGWSISINGATVAKNGQIPTATLLGTSVPSQGDPVVAADKTGNFFMGSLQFDGNDLNPNGITISRSPKAGSATGVFSAACTGGSDTDCWPTRKAVTQNACVFGSSGSGFFDDKPWIAVDRSGSAAAGSVYAVWTRFGCKSTDFSTKIMVAKCTNTLTSCTKPVALESTLGTASALDFVQLSHMAIGPNGKVYVTWVKHAGTSRSTEVDTIRLRVITPTASTTSVGTLGALRTVQVETLPIPFGDAPFPAVYRTFTYPKVGIKGTRAIVAWDRRATSTLIFFGFFYLDSNIVAKFTNNDGASFSALQTVSAATGHQYFPTVCVDSTSGRVVVGYYSTQNDIAYSHLQDVYVATSATGAAPYTPLRVTSVSNDTEADPFLLDTFIGDYIEASCAGGKAYVHYNANYVKKDSSIWGGSATAPVRQQDNFLGKVSLP